MGPGLQEVYIRLCSIPWHCSMGVFACGIVTSMRRGWAVHIYGANYLPTYVPIYVGREDSLGMV